MNYSKLNNPQIINLLRQGKLGIIPTDTIYGIHASIFHKSSINKIYQISNRDRNKPMIILISSINDLALFKIKPSPQTFKLLTKYWPGKISIILPVNNNSFYYLHRGQNSLAFRVPNNIYLQKLIEQTGPLVSTSANPQSKPPATTIDQAEQYFGDNIDFYVDAGKIKGESSTLIKIAKGKPVIIRQGSDIIPL